MGQGEFTLLQPMRFHLLGNQMPFGDLHLLVLGIPLQPDDLHAVEQRLRQVEAVGRAHEHHIRQVIIDLQIVILKLGVLLRVEHLQQRRGRIAAEILSQLVDLVEQEQRVAGAGLAQVGHDLARQRADIGAPVAPDLGLVAHAAQRLAHEFAPTGLGDALAQRGLAHARRANEAQDRALQLFRAGLHRQIFDNAVLHLVQRVMIGIQHGLRGRNILLQLAALAPRQPQQHIEIIAHNGRLGAHRLHGFQLLHLGLGLGARLFRQLGLDNFLGQLGQLIALAILAAAQFALNGLELLVEVIFALGLFHLALHAATDAALHLQHAQLTFHEAEYQLQALHRVSFAQQGLLVGHLGTNMGCHGVSQTAGVLDIAQLLARILRQLLVEFGVFVELLDHAAHHRRHFRAVGDNRLQRGGLGGQHHAVLNQPFQPDAALPLHQNAHRAIGQLQQLQHRGNNADVIEIVRRRVVTPGVELGNQHDILVARHRGLERRHRFLATNEQGHHHAGKHHDIAQGQQGQSSRALGSHVFKPSLGGTTRKGRASGMLGNMGCPCAVAMGCRARRVDQMAWVENTRDVSPVGHGIPVHQTHPA